MNTRLCPLGFLAGNWLDSKLQEAFGTEFRIVWDRHFLEAPRCDPCNVQSDLIYYSIWRELVLAWQLEWGGMSPQKPNSFSSSSDTRIVGDAALQIPASLDGHQIIHKTQHPVQWIIQGKPTSFWCDTMQWQHDVASESLMWSAFSIFL